MEDVMMIDTTSKQRNKAKQYMKYYQKKKRPQSLLKINADTMKQLLDIEEELKILLEQLKQV